MMLIVGNDEDTASHTHTLQPGNVTVTTRAHLIVRTCARREMGSEKREGVYSTVCSVRLSLFSTHTTHTLVERKEGEREREKTD